MKRTFFLLLISVMLLSLTACGNANQQGQADLSQSTAQGPENPSTVQPSEPDVGNVTDGNGGGVLVVYYSATGSTEAVAGYIANVTDADTFAITPAEPYTSDNLNWRDRSSRVSKEHDDASLRIMELTETTVDGWEDYDTVFIGYPIWWGIAAWPVDNFINANDFTGKTVIPFCTSSSSGLGESGDLLAELAGTGNWLEGQRFRSSVAEADVVEWVNGLNLQ